MKSVSFCLLGTCCGVLPASAATFLITDPARVTGAGAIDPAGSLAVSVNASGATPQATLEGVSAFGAIQSFAFSGSETTTDQWVFSNQADATLPDLRLSYTGSVNGGAVAVNNVDFATSGAAGMRLAPAASIGATFSFRIDLGNWDGSSFTEHSAAAGVEALGFTLAGRYYATDSSGVTISYLDGLGAVLSTQTLPFNPAIATPAGYTGYRIAPGENPIAAATISFTTSATNALFVMDDLGFSPSVPEPSTACLLACGAAPLLRRRRPRRRTALLAAGLAAGFMAGGNATAAIVVNDPARVTGSFAIDAAGSLTVSLNPSASGPATPQATLEALASFGAVQGFAGFTGNQSTTEQYIINHGTDATLPDLRVTYSGAVSTTSTVAVNNVDFATSGTASLRLQPTGAAPQTCGMTLDLGNWDAGGSVFTPFTASGEGVAAVGFTVSGRYQSATQITVTYRDAGGNVLSTQVLAQPSATVVVAGYTGYQIVAGQNPIASVTVTVTGNGTATNNLITIDDLGYNALFSVDPDYDENPPADPNAPVVVTDPVRTAGEDAIDPLASQEVVLNPTPYTPATPQATLESLATFAAIQDFAGFTGSQSATKPYVFHTAADATLPDVRLTYTGPVNTAASVAVNNIGFATSGTSSMRISAQGSAAAPQSFGLQIGFGEWNSGSSTFTSFSTSTAGVAAVGFTLSGYYYSSDRVTVTYLDALGAVLHVQKLRDPSGLLAKTGYSGYQIVAGQNPIATVTIAVTGNATATNGLMALDDLGFNALFSSDPVVDANPPVALAPDYGFFADENLLEGGPDGDDDGDGLDNAVEYVLGTDPNVSDGSAAGPSLSVTGGQVLFTFSRSQLSKTDDVTLVAEFSTDLVTWPEELKFTIGEDTASSSPGVTVTTPPAGDDTVTVTLPVGSDPRKFGRLGVTVQPF